MLRFVLFLLCLALALCPPVAAQERSRAADALKRAEGDTLQTLRAEQAFVRGMTRAYLGDYEAAIRHYERALDFRPDEPAVLAALAEAHEAEGDLTTALYVAAQAVEAGPEEPSTHRLLARLQLAAGEADAAVATYRRLLDLDPDDVNALTALARLHQQRGHFEEALAGYERVLDRVEESEAVRTRMLSIYQQLDDDAGIVRTLEALVALDPADAVLRRRLADRYRARGDSARADSLVVSPALSADEEAEAPPSLFQVGAARFRDGDWQAAADALQQALDDDPRNVAAWAQLVTAHLRAGNPDAALDAAEEATLLFPGQVALLRVAALAHAEAGHHDEAVRLFEDALRILDEERPDDTAERSILLEGLGDAEAARDRTDAARRYWQEALDLDSENAERLREKIDGRAP